MAARTLEERVTRLEKELKPLRKLPAQVARLDRRVERLDERMVVVELQIVQLRDEMHVGFSSVRGEMAEMKVELRAEFREDIAAQGRETAGQILGLQRQMLMLHEEVIDRLKIISDGRSS